MAHIVASARSFLLQQLHTGYDRLPTLERLGEHSPSPAEPSSQISKPWRLAPFFVANAFGRTDRRLPRPNSTSYVNGLRGVACIVVFNQHICWRVAGWIQYPYGIDQHNMYFLQLPFIRVVHCGMFMVAVFFVLSGFVLSFSALKKMNGPATPERDSALLTSLSSSLFRRPLRLFVPMMAAMSLTSAIYYVMPDSSGGHWRDNDPSFLQLWYRMMKLGAPCLSPFDWGYYWPKGFTHAWTLQMEYRGSIVVFLLCLLTCRLSSGFRKATFAFSAWYSLYWGRWEVFCFIEGMILADLRIAPLDLSPLTALLSRLPLSLPSRRLRANSLASPSPAHTDPTAEKPSRHHPPSPPFRTALWTTALALALLAGGWPTHRARDAQPWRALFAATPARWASDGRVEPDAAQCWWIAWAAGLLVLSLEALPRLQAPFNTRPLVYLGEISYAFYLMHQPVMFSIGARCFRALEARGFGPVVCFVVEYVVVMVVLVCVADWFWRAVDEKVVVASRSFARWCGV